jgi:1-deoxy-D-xylulose-5-phosphate synthase
MVGVAEDAAALLASDGVEARVVNMRWLKPMDLEAVASASACPLVVTLEENTGVGGFGAGVVESLADLDLEVPVLRLSIPDCFVTHGHTDQLLAEVGLTPDGVRAAVLGRLADIGQTTSENVDGRAQDRRRAR